jgi:hypothetical protein
LESDIDTGASLRLALIAGMVLSSEPAKTLSLESLNCEVRSGRWEPHVLREEAASVEFECLERPSNQLYCKVPNLDDFLKDINGLEFSASLFQIGFPELPKFIPVVEKRFLRLDPQVFPCEFVAVPVRAILASCFKTVGGRWRSPSLVLSTSLKDLPLFSKKRVILCMSGQDVLIEKLWQTYDDSYLSKLKEIGFEFATSPNFSVFAGECPLGHHVNQKKSLVFAEKLQEAGIKAIPHIYPITPAHLTKYITFFQRHSAVRFAIINCTLQRKATLEVHNICNRVSALLEAIPDLRLILQGLNFGHRALFAKVDARLHYASSSPTQTAIHKKHITYDCVEARFVRAANSTYDKEELVKRNIQAYIDFYRQEIRASSR